MTSNKNKSKARSMIYNFILIILLIIFDQVTKLLAVSHLKNIDSISLVRGVFELRYLENRGAAFGMMQNMNNILYRQWLLICDYCHSYVRLCDIWPA